MNQIISGIDYRIVNFMANNGRKPNKEETARLLSNDVNNKNNPNIHELQNRIAELINERDQASCKNPRFANNEQSAD